MRHDTSAPDPPGDLLDPAGLGDERQAETALRPRTLDEYIGQDRMKSNLRVFIAAARERQEPLDHVLLYGPPGLGKTTVAHILSAEMGAALRSTSGPAIERLQSSPIEEVVVTNTIPLQDNATTCKKITQLSVAKIFGEAIRRIHSGDSLSSLFV